MINLVKSRKIWPLFALFIFCRFCCIGQESPEPEYRKYSFRQVSPAWRLIPEAIANISYNVQNLPGLNLTARVKVANKILSGPFVGVVYEYMPGVQHKYGVSLGQTPNFAGYLFMGLNKEIDMSLPRSKNRFSLGIGTRFDLFWINWLKEDCFLFGSSTTCERFDWRIYILDIRFKRLSLAYAMGGTAGGESDSFHWITLGYIIHKPY